MTDMTLLSKVVVLEERSEREREKTKKPMKISHREKSVDDKKGTNNNRKCVNKT